LQSAAGSSTISGIIRLIGSGVTIGTQTRVESQKLSFSEVRESGDSEYGGVCGSSCCGGSGHLFGLGAVEGEDRLPHLHLGVGAVVLIELGGPLEEAASVCTLTLGGSEISGQSDGEDSLHLNKSSFVLNYKICRNGPIYSTISRADNLTKRKEQKR